MKSFSLTLLLLSAASAALAQAPVPTGKIARISIVHGGLNNVPGPDAGRVSDDAVRAAMTEKIGDTYSLPAARRDQRAIRSTGRFLRVTNIATADPAGGVDLTVTVVDAPVIRKIVFTANTPDGEPPVPAATLLGLMQTKVGQPLDMTTLRSDLNRLTDPQNGYLHQQGYVPDAEGYRLGMDLIHGVVNIHLREALIAQIAVTGNRQVPADDILHTMHSRAGDLLNQSTLQADMSRLQKTGFFQSVGPPQIDTTDRQVKVTVPVVERPNLKIAADPLLTPRPGEVLLEGTLREAYPVQQRLVLLILRTQVPGRPTLGLDSPRSQPIRVLPSTFLRPLGGGRAALSAFQPGDVVTIIGKAPGPGQPLLARVIVAQ